MVDAPKPKFGLDDIDPSRIPEELKALPCWNMWRANWNPKKGKFNKIPLSVHTGRHHDVQDVDHLVTFDIALEEAKRANADGVGFSFAPGCGFVGLDFDHCVTDGIIHPTVKEVIEHLGYCEISPSGSGVKVWVRADIKFDRNKIEDFPVQGIETECYDWGRYFTLTSQKIEQLSNGLADQTSRLRTFCRWIETELEAREKAKRAAKVAAQKPQPKRQSQNEGTAADLSDQDLWDAAFSNPRNGAEIQRLYRGDWKGYESQSQADLVLCNHLAFYTWNDAARMDRMFRQTELFRPEKWDRYIPSWGRTYGANTIAEAIAITSKHYEPRDPDSQNDDKSAQADLEQPAAEPGEWNEVKTFGSSQLPAFPLEIFPAWCRGYLEKVVEIGQVPTCFAGMPFLGALAIAFQKRFKVSLNFVWVEVLVLWILLIAPSGARKSPAFKCVVRFPLREWERQMAKRFKDVQIQAKKAIQDKQTAIEIAKKAKESTADLEQELASLTVPPTPKLYTGTATPESIEEKLGLHLGRYGFASAESDILAVLLGKYKQGQPPIEGLMAAHAGEDLKSDYRTREDVDVDGAHFTQIVFTQPPNAAKMFSSEALSGRGALGRYLPCLPHCELSEDLILEDVDIGLKSSYLSGFMRLLPSEEETRKAYESGDWHTREMTLSAEAWNVFEPFYKRTVRRRKVGGDLQFLEEWAPKFHGQVVRIAAILHLCDHYDKDEPPLSISVSAMQRAIRLGEEYLIPHAKAAYGEAEVFQADKVWDVLQRNGPEVNRRTIQQEVKPMSADELDRILETLEDAGYLRVEERSNGKRGRNPKFITLNPKAPRRIAQQSQKPPVNLRPVGPIVEPPTVDLRDVDLEDIL